jgi:hypothetical protein
MSLMDFVVSPPGFGRSVTEVPMKRSYVVPMRWMVIYKYQVTREALKPKFY